MSVCEVKLFVVGAVLVLALAFLYRRHQGPGDEALDPSAAADGHMARVLRGLLVAEDAVALDRDLRVAVGFGSCVDVIASAADVLRTLNASVPEDPQHFNTVHDQEEFERIFAYFFRHGAAAERYTNNENFFQKLAAIAKLYSETKVEVGGNAPVMAGSFLRHGVKVLLGAQMTEELRHRIGSEIEITGESVMHDDIHLILEYKKGEKWGKYDAPRANRFIIHNDANNPLLSTLESFGDAVSRFSPHVVVVGGLQMMDNFPFLPGQRQSRLEKLAAVLSSVPKETHIHFEMASFVEQECLKDIIDNVVFYSNSLGMNEQELPNLLGMLTNNSITIVSDPNPRIASTLDQMRMLYRTLREISSETGGGRRRLTRLHVHTLAFQAIMTQRGSTWKNSGPAAAKAALVANRHTCGSKQIQVDKARLLMDESFSTSIEHGSERIAFLPEQPVSCWQEGEVDICLAPVLVCTQVVQTVGGGDNISTAGLVLQV